MSFLTKFGKVRTLQNELIAFGKRNKIAWIENQNFNKLHGAKPLPPNKRGKIWYKDVTGTKVPPNISKARQTIAEYKKAHENINAAIGSVKNNAIKKVRFASTATPKTRTKIIARTKKRFSPFSSPFYVRRWQRRYKSLSSYTKSYTRRYSPSYPSYNKRFFPFRRYRNYRSYYRPYLRRYSQKSYSVRKYSPRKYTKTATASTRRTSKLTFDPTTNATSSIQQMLNSFESPSTPVASNTRSKSKSNNPYAKNSVYSLDFKRKHSEVASLIDEINDYENNNIKKPRTQSRVSKKAVETAPDRWDSTARDEFDDLHLPLDTLDEMINAGTIHANSLGYTNDFSNDRTVPNPFNQSKKNPTLVDLSSDEPNDPTENINSDFDKDTAIKHLQSFVKVFPRSKIGKLFLNALQSDTYDPNDPINRELARKWIVQARKKTNPK
jgi:hypothetical protein